MIDIPKYISSDVLETAIMCIPLAPSQGLESYGFRGEALSSLCSVAEVSVTTRTADQDAATRLEFDPMGRILSRSVVPRAVGTTVAVKNIFSRLPVRCGGEVRGRWAPRHELPCACAAQAQTAEASLLPDPFAHLSTTPPNRHRELKANLRRELARVTSVVQAYGLVARGVRLIATHQQGSGTRTVLVGTQGSAETKANMQAVFGARLASGLQPFEAEGRVKGSGGRPSLGTPSGEGGDDQGGDGRAWSIRGFVSKAGAGGRSHGKRDVCWCWYLSF